MSTIQFLYEDNHGWLCRWLRQRLDSADDAVDLAHDTFLRLLRRPDEVPGIVDPRAFLATIARGLLNDHWRRRTLEQAWLQTLTALPDELAFSPEQLVSMQQELQQLDAMLSQLAPKAREVFVLSQLEGLSYVQIAARTGLSDRTVKRYMAQGFELCLNALC
ncbi:sigma-70 family RNA polymerase sigma factor [Massilia sp. HP4]|uniref:sigma-70 family RNA polymerase sigma factor n=1 Tax=Massilia sp. HP4 TaxID=2562316 RepID=UPI0010C0B80E|nr:sigma-70 family RNA polymerase sigma factor [Massilia sp. HP4]